MSFTREIPIWNATGAEPPQSLKDSGWSPDDRPPAEYWNWQMNLTFKALQELQQYALHSELKGNTNGLAGLNSSGKVVHADGTNPETNAIEAINSYGFAAPSVKKYNVDANTLTESGRYYLYGSSSINKPFDSNFYVDVFGYDDGYALQVAYQNNETDRNLYFRTQYNGSWGAWDKVAMDKDLQAIRNLGFRNDSVSYTGDLNTLKQNGFYYSGSGGTNKPVGNNGYVLVENLNTITKQTWTTYNNATETFIRVYNGTSWEGWEKVLATYKGNYDVGNKQLRDVNAVNLHDGNADGKYYRVIENGANGDFNVRTYNVSDDSFNSYLVEVPADGSKFIVGGEDLKQFADDFKSVGGDVANAITSKGGSLTDGNSDGYYDQAEIVAGINGISTGANIKSVNRGIRTMSGSAEAVFDATANGVDISKSIIIVSNTTTSTGGDDSFIRGYFASGYLYLSRDDNGGSPVVDWQVVEFDDNVNVQSGNKGIGFGTTDVTISTIDLNKSFLIFANDTDEAGQAMSNQGITRGSIINSNTIRFEQDTDSDGINQVTWFVVEFP